MLEEVRTCRNQERVGEGASNARSLASVADGLEEICRLKTTGAACEKSERRMFEVRVERYRGKMAPLEHHELTEVTARLPASVLPCCVARHGARLLLNVVGRVASQLFGTIPTPAIWVSPTHQSRHDSNTRNQSWWCGKASYERCLSLTNMTTGNARVFLYGGSLTRTHTERLSTQLEPRLFRYKATGGALFKRQTTVLKESGRQRETNTSTDRVAGCSPRYSPGMFPRGSRTRSR